MLGPRGYRTRKVEGFSVPDGLPENCYAALIGFDPSHLLELEIWRRLFMTEFSDSDAWGIYLFGLSASESEAAQAMIPKSAFGKLLFISAKADSWRAICEGQSAVVFPRAQIAMFGPANEEAWDEAQALFITQGSNPPV